MKPELFKKFESGNITQNMRSELIKDYLKLAYSIATKYYGKLSMDPSYDREDLQQVAIVGLVKAANKFDIKSGLSFATFSTRCIENELSNFFRSEFGRVKYHSKRKQFQAMIYYAKEKLLKEGIEPNEDAVYELIKNDISKANYLDTIKDIDIIQLDVQLNGKEGDYSLADRIGGIDSEMEEFITTSDIKNSMEGLTEKQERVFTLKVFDDYKIGEIAEIIGSSKQNASVLFETANKKVKRKLTKSYKN